MTINLLFRGFRAGERVFAQAASFDESVSLATLLPALAKAHSALLAGPEPDPKKRFFRFGSDTSTMRDPKRQGPAFLEISKWMTSL